MEEDIRKVFEEMRREKKDGGGRGVDRDFKERMERLGDEYRPAGESYGTGDALGKARMESNRGKAKKRHPDNFDGPPPPNYICNRCEKKGT
jgi:hypothetical protein